MGSYKSFEVLNGGPGCKPELLTRKISSPCKTKSEHEHGAEEIQPMTCDPVGLENLGNLHDDASKYSSPEQLKATQENETNKLSQLDNGTKGQLRKREKLCTGSPRVLRPRSQEKSKIPKLVNVPAQDAESKEKKRRKKKQIKENQNDEFSKIRKHLKYLLSRMNYEQNLIDAYAGEGWRGQSLEKIKPEKELERAKSYIVRYKLKIRDLFQRVDASCVEGRLPESLFDSEGLIDSEDIFCAKCGRTDVQLDNDIILCDGTCERGFHQFCLEPPLLKEQVPPVDEGWLCPACDCKVDCIDLINDAQETNLSVSDSWKKVFPEAVASGNKQDDISGLPSDDSGDDDYNPDGVEIDEDVDGEESSSDESDFSSASEDLGAVANNEQYLGLPSEDSEDDDYNPDGLGSDEHVKSKSSSSEFTSDSEDFTDINKDEGTLAEVQRLSMSDNSEEIVKTGMEDDDSTPITAKRHVERLDYKKLHDETYGNVSSDSSDEDFFDTETPRRGKRTKGVDDMVFKQKKKQSESNPIERTGKKLDVDETSSSPAHKDSPQLGSGDKTSTKSPSRRLGEAVTQRLQEYFKENRYPDRSAKENLAKELKLKLNQVHKWFEHARWIFNHPRKHTEAGTDPRKHTEVGKSVPESSTSVATKGVASKAVEKKQLNKVNAIFSIEETHGNVSSDSKDEDFFDTEARRREKKTARADDMDSEQRQKRSKSIPIRSSRRKLHVEGTVSSPARKDSPAHGSGNRSTKSTSRGFGEAVKQKLQESFKESHYPDRNAKENLAKELKLTLYQVSKWFGHARWSFNHPRKHTEASKSHPQSSKSVATKNAASKEVEKNQLNKANGIFSVKETQGNVYSDSSDEDFFDTETPRRRKKATGTEDADSEQEQEQKQKQSKSTPIRSSHRKLHVEGTGSSARKDTPAYGSGNTSTKSTSRGFREAVTQILKESFKENHYPDRNAKENLAKELKLTVYQVSKWFEHARWCFKHPRKHTEANKSPPENAASKEVGKNHLGKANGIFSVKETHENVSSDLRDGNLFDTEASGRRKKTTRIEDKDFEQKQKQSESTPSRSSGKKPDVKGTSSSKSRGYGEAVTQRLSESFKENHYPDRNTKETLAKELNLTPFQVTRWFIHARRKRAGGSKSLPESSKSTPTKNAVSKHVGKNKWIAEKSETKEANEEASPVSPKSKKRKAKADHEEAWPNQSVRRSGRIRS